ncbi:hypothetical protein [Cronobacter malonaticus]|uniref:hypothetical protein n=1 Tax=Cronobacter malonaticus TaxID=413503 RepID=UPI00131A433D|nr:hypothetical protein [Cronobacter malonaticus]
MQIELGINSNGVPLLLCDENHAESDEFIIPTGMMIYFMESLINLPGDMNRYAENAALMRRC